MSQEKSKAMYMQILRGVKEVNYGICASREFGKKTICWEMGLGSPHPIPPPPPPLPSGTL